MAKLTQKSHRTSFPLDLFYAVFLTTLFLKHISAIVPIYPLAKMYGDPHFEGFDGIHFDFTGSPGSSYCLFTDPALHINIEMVGFELNGNRSGNGNGNRMRTWVKAIGFLRGGHSMEMRAKGGLDPFRKNGFYAEYISLDGEKIILSQGKTIRSKDNELSLEFLSAFGKEGEEEMERYELVTKNGFQISIIIRPESPEIREILGDDVLHFSVEVVNANALTEPHGIMGQSFRTEQKRKVFQFKTVWSQETDSWQVMGPNGEGYLDGEVDDYLSSSVLKPDCKFSKYSHIVVPIEALRDDIEEIGEERERNGVRNTAEEDKIIAAVYAELEKEKFQNSVKKMKEKRAFSDRRRVEGEIRDAGEGEGEREGGTKEKTKLNSDWTIVRKSVGKSVENDRDQNVERNGKNNGEKVSENLRIEDFIFEETAVRVVRARPRKILPFP